MRSEPSPLEHLIAAGVAYYLSRHTDIELPRVVHAYADILEGEDPRPIVDVDYEIDQED